MTRGALNLAAGELFATLQMLLALRTRKLEFGHTRLGYRCSKMHHGQALCNNRVRGNRMQIGFSTRNLSMKRMQPWVLILALLGGICADVQGQANSSAAGWQQKEFIITFWCPPPATDEALARVADEGFNLTWVPADGLDLAAKYHLRAMLTSDLLRAENLDDSAKRVQLDALIENVKKHTALEAYFLTDEPGAGAFSGLGKLVAYMKEHDPSHLAYINLYPTYANEEQLGVSADATERARTGYPQNYAGVGTDDRTVLRYREHLKKYLETVKPDLISYDHYHFLKRESDGAPTDGTQYFLNLALIRLAALEAGKPFLNIIQADTIEKSWRLPNATETRWLVFTTLAYGGRGLSYFTYWGPPAYNGLYVDGKPSTRLRDIVGLNKEISKFGPALLRLESVAVYHTAPLPYGTEAIPVDCPFQVTGEGNFVLGLFGKSGHPSAFMIVNRDYQHEAEAVVKIALPDKKLQELDRITGEWLKGQGLKTDRKIRVKLSPGDGRLFRMQGEERVTR